MPNNFLLFPVLSVISLWPLSSALGLFLSCRVFLCPGFAPLLLPAHFLKSSARPVQPAQPGRVHADQRSVHTHTLALSPFSNTHKHTLTPLHHVSLSLSAVPLPALDG